MPVGTAQLLKHSTFKDAHLSNSDPWSGFGIWTELMLNSPTYYLFPNCSRRSHILLECTVWLVFKMDSASMVIGSHRELVFRWHT